MLRKTRTAWVVIAITAVLLVGCSKTAADTTPTMDANSQLTAVAVTVQAELTKAALLTPTATETPLPSPTPAPTEITPTVADIIPTTAVPPTAAPTALTVPDQAVFVSDVTVPDGTKFAPGATFTKTWRIQNVGTTTWTTAYQVRYYAGDAMGASSSKGLSKQVAPNESIDISLDMKAPSTAGKYQGTYVLTNANGSNFTSFTVMIEVTGSSSATNTPGPTATNTQGAATNTPEATATEVVVPTETPSS